MKGNEEARASADSSARARSWRRDWWGPHWRSGGLAVLVAAAAVGLAACSGGSANVPQVASLGNSSGTNSGSATNSGSGNPAAAQSGNPTQLLDEWAACIRSHGDPNQADPAIDANKDIEITMVNAPAALEHEVHGSAGPCSSYLLAAETALRGGQPAPTDNPAQDVKFADCMRANGVPNFPDPSANGDTNFNGTGVDPNSPAVQNATKACDKKIGIPYYPPGTEVPGVVIERGCNGVPAGSTCPPLGGGNQLGPATSGNGGSGSNG